MEYINGNLVRKILVYKKRKNIYWTHIKGVNKFLWWKFPYDYWSHLTDTYTKEKMIEYLKHTDCYFENDTVYYYPYVELIFSENHSRIIDFNNVEELDNWIKDFFQKYPNIFIELK